MARLTNGGIIGKQITTPTISSASGKWNLSDQNIYKSANIWPLEYPSTLSNLFARWDASVESSIVKSGTAVSQWNDITTNGINLNIASGSPTYQASGLNSKPAIYFDGNDSLKSIATNISFASPGFTIFFAVDFTTNGIFMEHSADANSGSFYLYGATGNSIQYVGPSGNTSYNFSDTSWGSSGSSTVFTYQYNGTNSGHFIRKSKTQLTGTNGATANAGFSTVSSALYLMSRAGSSYHTTGHVSEILLYKSVLTLTEIQNVENYLYNKWGIV